MQEENSSVLDLDGKAGMVVMAKVMIKFMTMCVDADAKSTEQPLVTASAISTNPNTCLLVLLCI